MHNLVVSMFLFKDTLINVYCWFINIEYIAITSITHAWMKFIIFIRYITASLNLGKLDSTAMLGLGHFK